MPLSSPERSISVDERPPEASTADAAQGPTTWTVGEILRSVFRRRVPHQLENLVHAVGMTLLLAMMIYVNVRDFIDPVIP